MNEDHETFRPAARGAAFVAFLCLVACQGDDGPPGPPGSAGPPGPSGPTGPSGALPVTSAERINVEVTGVDVPAGGGAPVVSLRLMNDLGQALTGLPAGNIRFVVSQLTPGSNGGSSEWQSYVTRSSAGIPNAQATTEAATAGTYVDNGDGTYRYTFAMALTDYSAGPAFDATKTHRLGVEIRTSSDGFFPENIPANNAPFDFVPGGGSPMFTRLIVDSNTCNACHDRLELHGEARFDVEYCVQCHNPYSIDGDTGNSVDMKEMIHKIHYGENLANGYQIIGFGGTLHDFSDVAYPQDIRNCQACHEESDQNTPQASNWRLVSNRAACGSCHDDIDWANAGHPVGLTFIDDTQCIDCHGPDATVNNGEVQVARAHEIPVREAAKAFAFEVVSASDTGPGEMPAVTIRVTDPTNGDQPYDIFDPAGPFSDSTARLRARIAWTTDEFGNVDPNDELARDPVAGAPFQPLEIDLLTGPTTDNTDGTFTATATSAIPTTAAGSGSAILEGRALLDADGDGGLDRIPIDAARLTFAITDTVPRDRRSVVDVARCNDCHDRLSDHGSARTNNTELCTTCHNPNATDIDERVGTCVDTFGADDVPIDFKRMIHRIHSSGQDEYGGVFEVDCGDVFQVNYPGRLNDCEGCHLEGTYYPVDPAEVLATTVDAGADRSTLLDDVAISPNAAVCSSCHTSALAVEHMRQNGADFEAAKAADGTLISAGVETCALCHGPGRSADVKEVHGVGTFLFN
ncbi:MAG TPA: OmcA/MtrC family decaheme c-type cytochrome [Gammaproteobacteria bacterium]